MVRPSIWNQLLYCLVFLRQNAHRPPLAQLTQPRLGFSSYPTVTFQTSCHSSDPNTFQAIFIFLTATPLFLTIPIMIKLKEVEKNKSAHSKLIKPPPSCNLDHATDEPKTAKKGIDNIVEDNKYPKELRDRVVAQILRAFSLSRIKPTAKKKPGPGGEIMRNQSDFKVNTKLDKVARKMETLNRRATTESSFELVEKEEETEEPEPVAKIKGTLH